MAGQPCLASPRISRTPSETPRPTRRPASGACRSGWSSRVAAGERRAGRSRGGRAADGRRGAGAATLAVLVAGRCSAPPGVVLGGDLSARGRLAFRLTLGAVALVIVGFLLSA